jgi:S1-C subfamily serine protease
VQIIAAGGTEVAANADPRMKDPFFRKFFGPPPSQEAPPSIGSGFILDDSGLVVTNLHVVRNAKNVQVILADGTKVPGVIRGSDEWTDIAVIQMKNAKNIRPARLGDSDKVYVGDYVVALGNPFGLQGTFSTGVVSAVARSVPGDPGMKFLQTDAAINPGNSGGPLINLDGEVIGINRMIVSPAGGSVGIGFAIPINEVKKVIADIKANGTVVRPALGNGTVTSTITPTPIPSVNLRINSIELRTITATTARIQINLNEPSPIDVLYGTSPTRLNKKVTSLSTSAEHIVELTDLSANTQYFFTVGTRPLFPR